MSELALKYKMLEPVRKQELMDFLDFLLLKQQKEKNNSETNYEKKLLSVSQWSEKDIEELEENIQKMSKWEIPNW